MCRIHSDASHTASSALPLHSSIFPPPFKFLSPFKSLCLVIWPTEFGNSVWPWLYNYPMEHESSYDSSHWCLKTTQSCGSLQQTSECLPWAPANSMAGLFLCSELYPALVELGPLLLPQLCFNTEWSHPWMNLKHHSGDPKTGSWVIANKQKCQQTMLIWVDSHTKHTTNNLTPVA